jgi:hypothetical protein
MRLGRSMCAGLALSLCVLLASAQPARPEGAKGVTAVVVKSWSNCSSSGVVWDELNANWSSYGTIPISIDYANPELCGSSFTLEALEASQADVVILDDPAGAGNHLIPKEVAALRAYAHEGHDVIGTYLTFYWDNGGKPVDNTALAPLFGLVRDNGWTGGDNSATPTYTLRARKHAAKRLVRNLPNPYVSDGFPSSQLPSDGAWSMNDLAGATIVGFNHDQSAVITVFPDNHYQAIYIASMPEYLGGTQDQQFLYNAIIYPREG